MCLSEYRNSGQINAAPLNNGTARVILRLALLRRLRQQTAFCYGQEHDPGAGLLPLREVQKQSGRLHHALYPRGDAETVYAKRRIFDVTAMFFEDIMSFQKAVYEQRFEEAEKSNENAQAGNLPSQRNG